MVDEFLQEDLWEHVTGDDEAFQHPLGELDDQLEYYADRESKLAARNAGLSGKMYRVPSLGVFISPSNMNWDSYNKAISSQSYLKFSSKQHGVFDGTIARISKLPALEYPDKKAYAKYEPLRQNLAVMRNYLANHFFPDGKFDADDPKDAARLNYMGQIGDQLGDILNNSASILPSLGASINFKDANTEQVGAEELYKELLKSQNLHRSWYSAFIPWQWAMGQNDSLFKLPPLEETPFFNRHRSASQGDKSSSPTNSSFTAEQVIAMNEIGTAFALGSFAGLSSVDNLSSDTKEEAIEEARKILKYLKITFGNIPVVKLQDFPPSQFNEVMDEVGKVVETLYLEIEEAQNIFGEDFVQNPEVILATEAAAKLGAQYKIYAMQEAIRAGDTGLAEKIAAEIENIPEEIRTPSGETLNDLLHSLEHGLEYTIAQLNGINSGVTEQNQRVIDPRQLGNSHKNTKDQQIASQIDFNQDHNAKRQQQSSGLARQADVRAADTQKTSGKLPAKGFDKLLGSKDIKQLQSSVNGKHSGDTSMTEPNSAAKAVKQQIANAQRQQVINANKKQQLAKNDTTHQQNHHNQKPHKSGINPNDIAPHSKGTRGV